jgi:hypothetical protein
MNSRSIRLSALSQLQYGDPKGYLESLALLEAEVSASDLPLTVKHLRTNRLKSERERRDAAIFCIGMSQALNSKVRFSLIEAQDYDFVATWQSSDTRHFCPIQLKELVSHELNPTASIQAVLRGLLKYVDSDDLTVVIKIGRNKRFEPSELHLPSQLSIAALWIFGSLTEDQTEWALWGNFVQGSSDGIKFRIPR